MGARRDVWKYSGPGGSTCYPRRTLDLAGACRKPGVRSQLPSGPLGRQKRVSRYRFQMHIAMYVSEQACTRERERRALRIVMRRSDSHEGQTVRWVLVALLVGLILRSLIGVSEGGERPQSQAELYAEEAAELLRESKFSEAADKYQLAAREALKEPDGEGKAQKYLANDNFYRAMGIYNGAERSGFFAQADLDEAIQRAQQARDLFRQVRNQEGEQGAEGWRLFLVGVKNDKASRFKEAREDYEKARRVFIDLGESAPELKGTTQQFVTLAERGAIWAATMELIWNVEDYERKGGEINQLLADLKKRVSSEQRPFYEGLEALSRGQRLFLDFLEGEQTVGELGLPRCCQGPPRGRESAGGGRPALWGTERWPSARISPIHRRRMDRCDAGAAIPRAGAGGLAGKRRCGAGQDRVHRRGATVSGSAGRFRKGRLWRFHEQRHSEFLHPAARPSRNRGWSLRPDQSDAQRREVLPGGLFCHPGGHDFASIATPPEREICALDLAYRRNHWRLWPSGAGRPQRPEIVSERRLSSYEGGNDPTGVVVRRFLATWKNALPSASLRLQFAVSL